MIAAALSALLSHWRQRPGQGLTLVLGLALATALWCAVQAINAEARASYDQASAALGGGSVISLTAPGGRIHRSVWAQLRRDGWDASPRIEGELVLADTVFALIGVEPLSASTSQAMIGGGEGVGLAFLTAPGVLLAAPETVEAPEQLTPPEAPCPQEWVPPRA